MLLDSESEALVRPPVLLELRPDAVAKLRSESVALRGRRLSTILCFGISVLVLGVTVALYANERLPWLAAVLGWIGLILFGASTLVASYRAIRGAVALVRPSAREQESFGAVLGAMLGNLVLAAFGLFVAYLSTVGFSRGRQLRRLGRVILPRLRPETAWTNATVGLDKSAEVPKGVAEQWRENGRTEHASVAAFARLTLDLMALGAPPTLIAAANQDALDEIRHAELCFSLARALDGKSIGPAPFPQAQRVGTLPRSRPLALAKLAVDSLVDGALHEGVSARIIAKLSSRSEVPAIRGMLKEIAADEGRHAAHGWTVVRWCLDEGGGAVAAALMGALRALPPQMQSELPVEASSGAWERWGIHGHALESKEYAEARAHLIERVHVMVSEDLAAA